MHQVNQSNNCNNQFKKFISSIAFTVILVICLHSQHTIIAHAFYTSTSSSVTISPSDELPVVGDSSRETTTLKQRVAPQKSPLLLSRQFGDTINDIQIECNSNNIVVTLNTNHGFNGMIYPKGLSKNSTCMVEYHQMTANITYYLPLRSCNTMSTDVEDGVEYFNTVMVQPHRRLVTNQGRGYHIRCRYQTKERTITNQDQQLSVNLTHLTPPVVGSATMPSCTMKIYSANDLSHEVAAENVRIGDELHLMISLDEQDVYGMLVTNCLVRDGMNWGEQPLIDDHGCPVDEDIMPQFVYAQNLTKASVTFQAHKFPYTSSVYYQCNVKLCFREGGCNMVPPNCDKRNINYRSLDNEIHQSRSKRWVDAGELEGTASGEELLKAKREALVDNSKEMSIEVFSGLNVDESDLEGGKNSPSAEENKDPMMMASTSEDAQQQDAASSKNSKQSEKDFCLSMRKFAIAVSLASLLLMTAIIIMIACMIQRRKRERLEESQHHTASIYDHHRPYSNSAYCRN